jgi:hypothetical protein
MKSSSTMFKPGDLVKPKQGNGWSKAGIILAEVIKRRDNHPDLYDIHILVIAPTTAKCGWRVGQIGAASCRAFFDHV